MEHFEKDGAELFGRDHGREICFPFAASQRLLHLVKSTNRHPCNLLCLFLPEDLALFVSKCRADELSTSDEPSPFARPDFRTIFPTFGFSESEPFPWQHQSEKTHSNRQWLLHPNFVSFDKDTSYIGRNTAFEYVVWS